MNELLTGPVGWGGAVLMFGFKANKAFLHFWLKVTFLLNTS